MKGTGGRSSKGERHHGGGGKGGKGPSACSIKDLHEGLLEAKALPGGAGYVNDENTLYVANLPPDCGDVDLYKIFSPFGAIAPKGVRAMQKQDGSCKGFGFVNFMDQEASAAAVMTLHGTALADGTTLIVREKVQSDKDVRINEGGSGKP